MSQDRMAITRAAVAGHLRDPTTGLASGFSEFDRILIAGAADISQACEFNPKVHPSNRPLQMVCVRRWGTHNVNKEAVP